MVRSSGVPIFGANKITCKSIQICFYIWECCVGKLQWLVFLIVHFALNVRVIDLRKHDLIAFG